MGMRARPRRRAVVLALIVLGAVLLATGSATWVTATTWTALDAVVVEVPGSRAAPAVQAAGLIVGAAALALAMARRVAALVAAGAVVLGGVLAVVGSVVVVTGPADVARAGAAHDVGVGGAVEGVGLTWAPWAGLLVGLAVVGAGVGAALASRHWHVGTRHEAPTSARAVPTDDWDALTRGTDPSDPSDRTDPWGSARRGVPDEPPPTGPVR